MFRYVFYIETAITITYMQTRYSGYAAQPLAKSCEIPDYAKYSEIISLNNLHKSAYRVTLRNC